MARSKLFLSASLSRLLANVWRIQNDGAAFSIYLQPHRLLHFSNNLAAVPEKLHNSACDNIAIHDRWWIDSECSDGARPD